MIAPNAQVQDQRRHQRQEWTRRAALGVALRVALRVALALLLAGCGWGTPGPTPEVTLAPAGFDPPRPIRPLTELQMERTAVSLMGTVAAQYTPRGPRGVDPGTPTPTPRPTQAFLGMKFIMADGLVMYATYRAGEPIRTTPRGTPAILILPSQGETKDDWADVAARLQGDGFTTLAVDVRGAGQTGGAPDPAASVVDAQALVAHLRDLPGVDPNNVRIIGAGTAATDALRVCAADVRCRAAALISPRTRTLGTPAEGVMAEYGGRPFLAAAGRTDDTSAVDSTTLHTLARGAKQLLIFDGEARGAALLREQPGLVDALLVWAGQ